jgi:hypothetical protein
VAFHCDLNSFDGAGCLLWKTELRLLIVSNRQKEIIIKKMPLPPPKQRTAYGTYLYRDILIEHLGRNLACECQVLYDKRELRKEALKRQFGVDLDGGEVGLIDLTGTANPFHTDIRFLFRFLTSDDRLVKFPLSKKKSGYGQGGAIEEERPAERV